MKQKTIEKSTLLLVRSCVPREDGCEQGFLGVQNRVTSK